MTCIEDASGKVVAHFESRDEALLCLPAMARILHCALRFRVNENGAQLSSSPLPRGCQCGLTRSRHTITALPL